jgi:hypothetical protein
MTNTKDRIIFFPHHHHPASCTYPSLFTFLLFFSSACLCFLLMICGRAMLWPFLFKLGNCSNNGVMLPSSPSSHDALLLLFKIANSTTSFLQPLPLLVSLLDCLVGLVSKTSTAVHTVEQVSIKGEMPLRL